MSSLFKQEDILKSEYIKTKRYTIHTQVSQARTKELPIVMVHGFGISSTYMLPIAKELSSTYRIYAPDLPGFGKSTKPKKVLNISEHAESLAEWMESMNLNESIFLGNSFGCQVIVEFALKYPGKIRAAILIGPTVDPHRRSLFKQFVALKKDSKLEPKEQDKLAKIEYRKSGIKRLSFTTKYIMEDKIEEKLPEIKVPVLIVRGGKDPFVSQKWAEEATDLLQNGKLKVIPGKGHTSNTNAPRELAKIVKLYISENMKKSKN